MKRETVSAPAPPKPAAPAALPYRFPPLDLLTEDPGGVSENIRDELQENAVKLVDTLKSFRVNTKIENISRGPTITRYELVPEPGTKVRSITNLVDDIALNLATTGVRIEAPIPGKSAVGIEVPNKKRTTVHLRTLLETEAFQNAKSRLTVALGEDVAGDAVYFDIGKMPHQYHRRTRSPSPSKTSMGRNRFRTFHPQPAHGTISSPLWQSDTAMHIQNIFLYHQAY